jgi:hypothetical protein
MAKDKDTIREALPDEYKDKLRQEVGREGNKARYGSGQATDLAIQAKKAIFSGIRIPLNLTPLAQ